jgi:hypothetical protein
VSSPLEDRLLALATCLCAEIEANPVTPGVCFCGLVPGALVAFDYMGDCGAQCGMAWVRIANAYPSQIIGAPSVVPGNCANALGLDVEVGIVRCIPGLDEDGTPPGEDALLASTLWQMEDANTMRRAIMCCEGSRGFLLGPYAPIGPDGGLVGGSWLVSMQES